MEHLCLLILLSNLIYFSISLNLIIASDRLTPSESLKNGDTLVSEGEVFEMGFFSPANYSNNKYLGIWYKSNPALVVWVANRNYPLSDSNGTLTVHNQGNLLLLNQMRRVIWSSNNSRVAKNPVAQILDSGNLVVRDSRSSDIYLWQSFDHPTDTLFAGMKLGWDLNTGVERYLTSWKSSDDPSIGEFTYRINITAGLPQLILNQGSTRKFRSGPWNGVRFSGLGAFENRGFKPVFVGNENEYYYFFGVSDSSVSSRVTMNISGLAQLLILHNKSSTEWNVMYTVPYEKCDGYGFCGDNGVCKISTEQICECLEGFKPRSQGEWEVLNWSNGCVRKMPLDCQKGEDFIEIERVKLPDLLEFWMNKSKTLEECKEMCLKNCFCTAYASLDVRGGGSDCLMWFGNLIDVRELSSNDSEQVIYVRLAALEIKSMRHENRRQRLKIIVALTTSGLCILGLSMLIWCIIRKIRTRITGPDTKKEEIDIPLFDFGTIATATNNFSPTCILGEGGFGPVYKGILSTGKVIAVKRLSKRSGQGVEEFKNELVLIAKLQHKNLVGLLGCCIKDEEMMLIYEYMSNNSLDHFIFDHKKSSLLEWENRFNIVLGIARGLLYLHEDSKLQIIHRDLKLSNILLDSNMNPKISDFGLARIFGVNERETKTKRVVGTYGYMSPEYAVDGKISRKADVFSFGVVLLEIISGKRNRFFSHPDHYHNLLGHAWLLWSEGRALELLDACLLDSCVESQVLRCIQVGLLCVQKLSVDRPTMASVVFMLANEEARLSQPKQPGFFEERSAIDENLLSTREERKTKNEITVTLLEGR